MTAPPPRTKPKICSSCRAPFTAIRTRHGWPGTCGAAQCRIAALTRLIERLEATRAKLAAGAEPVPVADVPWEPKAS